LSVPRKPEGSILQAAACAPSVDIETIAPQGTILIIAPHPDDETFGCGMAMAAAADRLRKIAIVLLTDGEGSHPNSPHYQRDRLVALRSTEFADALKILVPTTKVDVLRMHLPDGNSRYDRSVLGRVVAFAHRRQTAAVWSTWRGDPHCDHETAGLLASDVAKSLAVPLWSFAVWGRFGDRSVPARLTTFHDATMMERKRKAIAAYRSQTDRRVVDDPSGFTMPPALVRHFAAHPELFIGG